MSSPAQQLFDAIERQDEALVRSLLQSGSPPDSCTPSGWAALHSAASYANGNIALLLLEAGADPNATDVELTVAPLHIAARQDCAHVAELLVAYGADLAATDSHKNTPLHRAADADAYHAVAALCAAGASVEAINDEDHTPLHVAAINSADATGRVLLEHRARIDVADKGLLTPLHLAAMSGCLPLVKAMLRKSRRSDLEMCDDCGHTALHIAIRYRRREVALLLAAEGASLHSKTQRGETALMLATLAMPDLRSRLEALALRE